MIHLLETKKTRSDINSLIIKAVNDYIEQQHKDGKGVTYNEIVGALEFTKIEFIDNAFDE